MKKDWMKEGIAKEKDMNRGGMECERSQNKEW